MSDAELREMMGGRSDLADLAPYKAPQMSAPVKLNTNESPFPPPEAFVNDLAQRVARIPFHRYPDRDFTELREGLARHLGVLTDRVWLANGSNEILLQLLLSCGGADRKAMTFEPTYTMHSHIVRVSGTRLLRARRNPDFTMHLDATLEAIGRQQPEVVFLCSPNNPTGTTNSAEEIAAICEAAPGLVILDEAYGEFAGEQVYRMIEDHEQLAVVRTFSKAWRMAGARLGYLVAQPWVQEQILKVRLPYHLSALTQAAGLAALANAREITAHVQTIIHERGRLLEELSTTRGVTAFPSRANFVLFRCESKPAGDVWNALLDKGVLIRDFSDTPGCDNCLRVSVGTPEQNERFLETLSTVLR
ncbi:MAG: histidinol-phosphate transaminase [Actinomycetota bacterium]